MCAAVGSVLGIRMRIKIKMEKFIFNMENYYLCGTIT